MASYQPQHPHQQAGRRTEERNSFDSLDSAWIITSPPQATQENVFSDSDVSGPLSNNLHSTPAHSEQWIQQVSHSLYLVLTAYPDPRASDIDDPLPYT